MKIEKNGQPPSAPLLVHSLSVMIEWCRLSIASQGLLWLGEVGTVVTIQMEANLLKFFAQLKAEQTCCHSKKKRLRRLVFEPAVGMGLNVERKGKNTPFSVPLIYK